MTDIPTKLQDVAQAGARLAPILRSRFVGMFMRSLFMTSLVFPSAGCVIFPDIESEPEEDLFPPVIVVHSLWPEGKGLTIIEEGCNLTFKVGVVRDRNVDDTLHLRWFLDWDPNNLRISQVWNSLVFSMGSEERSGDDLWFELKSGEFIPGDDTNEHTLLVFVADRLMKNNPGIEFPDTDEGSQAQYTYWQWTFKYGSGGLCDE